jgi:hypothetical protein
MSKLVLEKAHSLQTSEVELLCKAFSILKFNTFFDNFILSGQGESIEIRPRKSKEQQVFGGEDEAILKHIQNYFATELIISPNIECLNSLVKLKDQSREKARKEFDEMMFEWKRTGNLACVA